MMRAIYGLPYDYEEAQGHDLVISKEPGLPEAHLVEHEVQMLKQHAVPQLLPIEFEEKDFRVSLRYSLSSKRMLSHVLRGRPISMREFFMLCTQIITILDESKNYMLREQYFILEEAHIYVGHRWDDVYLLYIPIEELPNKAPLRDEIKVLLTNLLGYVSEIHGHAVQEMIRYCSDDHFQLSELKQNMLEWMDEAEPEDLESAASVPRPKPEVSSSAKEIERNGGPEPEKASASSPKPNDVEKKAAAHSSRFQVVMLCAGALILALVWRMYLQFQSPTALYVSVALTVLTCGLLIGVYYKNDVFRSRKGKPADVPSERERFRPTYGETAAAVQAPVRAPDHYERLEDQTRLLAPEADDASDETVLLDTDNTEGSGCRAYLLVKKGNRTEEVEMNQDRFMIGRNADQSDYAIDHQAVGRAHMEIFRVGTRFILKDLGSVNGTYLNEERLVPNKTYELREEDCIHIAQIQFIFRNEQA